ncbi:MAG: hypothetical protein Q9225_006801 [Loekoesia sp. 1 TL-2023]
MWSQIAERFHVYQPKVKGPNGRVIRQRIKKIEPARALKYARKSLKYLQRANDGHMLQLQTVLNMTYGRVGKRSRQIMAKLQAPHDLVDDAAVANLSNQISEDPRGHRKVPKLRDETMALLKSQIKQDPSRFDQALPKGTQPNVPAVNSWGRPFPQKRRANFIRNWYKVTMGRLMPPLPACEWERLQGLATGTTPWDGPVPRRKLGSTLTIGSRDPLERFVFSNLPHRLTSSTERVVEYGRNEETQTNPHELTPRLMRSMWSKVFQKCPRLDWSNEKSKWVVTWGHRGKKADLVLSPQKELPLEVFEGVDDHGKIIPEDGESPLEVSEGKDSQPSID